MIVSGQPVFVCAHKTLRILLLNGFWVSRTFLRAFAGHRASIVLSLSASASRGFRLWHSLPVAEPGCTLWRTGFDKMMEKGSQQANRMRENSASPARILPRATALTATFAVWLAMMIGVLPLAGCGDFWQAPGSTGTSTGTTATTTTLTTPNSGTTTGTSVVLTATVSPSAATGTVTFYNNSSSIGTGTLSSGVATYTATFSTAGTESLTATYGGDTTYASSTSSAVTLTVTAASTSARTQPVVSASALTNTAYGSSPLHAISDFNATGGTYTAKNAQAAVVESGGSITLTNAALSGAAGNGSGVLLSNRTANVNQSVSPASPPLARFTMTGGSLSYNCSVKLTDSCDEAVTRTQSNPATLLSVAGTKAAITLTDVKVTNNTATNDNPQGTLLTVSQSSATRSIEGDAAFTAQGTTLVGDIRVDPFSAVAFQILKDAAGTGSSFTGAINQSNAGKSVSLALDESSIWTVTAASYLTSVTGLDLSSPGPGASSAAMVIVNNIDGGGHCVYYSGSVDGSGVDGSNTHIYALSGGGFLAPAGTTGLACR